MGRRERERPRERQRPIKHGFDVRCEGMPACGSEVEEFCIRDGSGDRVPRSLAMNLGRAIRRAAIQEGEVRSIAKVPANAT